MKSLAKRKRLTKKQRRRRNRWVLVLLAAILVFIGGYITGDSETDFSEIRTKLDDAVTNIEQRVDDFRTMNQPPSNPEGTSQIHLFDVGQGSSTLLIGSDDTSVLIDTGRYDDSEKRIISYLDNHIGLGEEIDLMIFTHNDADHIGHGDLVLEYFDVNEVWMNGMDHTSQVYDDLLDTLVASDVEYAEPKAGESHQRGVFDIQVLHPLADSPQSDPNDESLVTRFEFDGISLMNSGDTSIPRENEIVERNRWGLQSDLLIAGHHGAANSTGEAWIQAVNPQMAFYQAGIDNTYGHPAPETIERLEGAGVPVYGTDELGTISMYIDENGEVDVQTER